jgi:hypothetical protein
MKAVERKFSQMKQDLIAQGKSDSYITAYLVSRAVQDMLADISNELDEEGQRTVVDVLDEYTSVIKNVCSWVLVEKTPEEDFLENVEAMSDKLFQSFERYSEEHVPWEWFRDAICSIYTTAVLRLMLKKKFGVNPEAQANAVLTQLRDEWFKRGMYQKTTS